MHKKFQAVSLPSESPAAEQRPLLSAHCFERNVRTACDKAVVSVLTMTVFCHRAKRLAECDLHYEGCLHQGVGLVFVPQQSPASEQSIC